MQVVEFLKSRGLGEHVITKFQEESVSTQNRSVLGDQ